MRDITMAMASVGITHMSHLITGWDDGESPHIMTYDEILTHQHARTLPFSKTTYTSLLKAIPTEWRAVIYLAARYKQLHPIATRTHVIQHLPYPPGTWIRDDDNRVGKIVARTPRVLHAFSGRAHREDGLAAALKQRGISCNEIDTKRHDLLDDKVFKSIMKAVHKGEYEVGIFGVPCSSFSIARMADGHGPNLIRTRREGELYGIPGLPPGIAYEVECANELMRRSVKLARALHEQGKPVIFENPPDRACEDHHDSVVRSLYNPDWSLHAPLWIMPEMIDLKRDLNLSEVTFAQCMLGSPFQKYTTL